MTGLSRQQAAEAVAALFGATAIHSRSSRTYDPWEVTDNEGKTWRFVSDNSIRVTHRSGRRQLFTSYPYVDFLFGTDRLHLLPELLERAPLTQQDRVYLGWEEMPPKRPRRKKKRPQEGESAQNLPENP